MKAHLSFSTTNNKIYFAVYNENREMIGNTKDTPDLIEQYQEKLKSGAISKYYISEYNPYFNKNLMGVN